MGAKIKRRTTVAVELPNGVEAELPSFCADAVEVKVVRVGDGFVVGAVVPDSDSSHADPRENDDGFGDFKEFRSQDERDAFIESALQDGKLAFLVDKYEHGQVHYSVSGTVSYVDRQWDVAPSGVFVPCEDVQAQFAARREVLQKEMGSDGDSAQLLSRAHAAAAQEFIKSANASLDEFSDWANGSVYGVCKYRFNQEGRRVDESMDDEVWGMIGRDYADQELGLEIDCAAQPQGEIYVGFVTCSAEHVSMLEGYGFNAAAYDFARGGVFVDISPERKDAGLAELANFPKDFQVELNHYRENDPAIATWQGTGAVVDLERRKAAQLAWAERNFAAKDIDRDSAAYWKELIARITARAAELAQGDPAKAANSGPSIEEGLSPGT